MQKRKKNLIIANACVVFCTLAFVLVSYIISKHNLMQCRFLSTFHLYCPGCGGTRAVYALLRLDIIASIIYNPMVLLGGLVYIYYNVRAIIAIKNNNEEYFIKQKYMLLPILAVILIVYSIIRNILLFNGIDLIGDVLGKGVI